jgi:hypothetical protein
MRTTSTPAEVIRRCQRHGRILWSHVAQQLGLSVDQVRSRHDPEYLKTSSPQDVRNAA